MSRGVSPQSCGTSIRRPSCSGPLLHLSIDTSNRAQLSSSGNYEVAPRISGYVLIASALEARFGERLRGCRTKGESGQPFARPLLSKQSTSERGALRLGSSVVAPRRAPRRDAPPARVLRAKGAERARPLFQVEHVSISILSVPLRPRGPPRHSIGSADGTSAGGIELSPAQRAVVLTCSRRLVALGRCLVLLKFSGGNCRPSHAHSENRRNLSVLEQLSAGSADGLLERGRAVRLFLGSGAGSRVTAADDRRVIFASRSSSVHAAGRL